MIPVFCLVSSLIPLQNPKLPARTWWLGFHPRHPGKIQPKLGLFPRSVAICHNMWGSVFADLMPAQRRIGLLHSDWTDLRPFLRSQQGLLDGVLCVSNALVELVAECLPEMAKEIESAHPLPGRRPRRDAHTGALGQATRCHRLGGSYAGRTKAGGTTPPVTSV